MNNLNAYEEMLGTGQSNNKLMDHIGLVKRVALHLKTRLPNFMELEELIQVGTIGLIEAAKSFDDSKSDRNQNRIAFFFPSSEVDFCSEKARDKTLSEDQKRRNLAAVFDKNNKEMVQDWYVVVRNETKTVKLYCPECWNRAKGLIEQIKTHGEL